MKSLLSLNDEELYQELILAKTKRVEIKINNSTISAIFHLDDAKMENPHNVRVWFNNSKNPLRVNGNDPLKSIIKIARKLT